MKYFHDCQPGNAYVFTYTNYKSEVETRHVIFRTVSWGSNEFYPDLQFFFTGFDVDKKAVRSFSFAKIDIKSFRLFTDYELERHLAVEPELDLEPEEAK